MGARGGIGSFYNLVPELFMAVWEAGLQGDWKRAHCAQAKINELIDLTYRYPVFPAIKRMLAWSGLDCGGCHQQYRPLTAEEEQALRGSLSQSSLAGGSFAGLRIAEFD
jgi:N-acetylneuraminate lyase